MLRYVDNPLVGGDSKVLRIAKIEDRTVSKISIMPTGLLDQLTREEVLDLIAYVVSKGDKDNNIYSNQHGH